MLLFTTDHLNIEAQKVLCNAGVTFDINEVSDFCFAGTW